MRFSRSVLILAQLWVTTLIAAENPQYVGRTVCANCHQEENKAWLGSHHDLAMEEADENSVLGNFENSEFKNYGITSRFYRDNGKFMINTDGPDGKMHDYVVRYTFGVYPLQQYLVEFPGGRLQALDIAWDSRKKEEGGQRWFHLHPDEEIKHDDVLHWTGPNLNWNYMCADCHSTNLKKNYNQQSNSYKTTWSEIDVSCEACHGPGSSHQAWGEAFASGKEFKVKDKGLTVLFQERKGVAWTIDQETGKAIRSAPKTSHYELDVCARCHSRRSQLTDNVTPGEPFMDSYRPSLLSEGLYYPDGQMEDEVYVWGSFMQSKMHQSGVTCSDCHDPHKADLRVPGDQVCYQCHMVDRYATNTHHFHKQEDKGASCVECHMPPTTYMGVDARHDHSFRVPRPDLTVEMGTPNACNKCHGDKSPEWAQKQLETWYGKSPEGFQVFASALAKSRSRHPSAQHQLAALALNADHPEIARATAYSELSAPSSQQELMLLQQGLNDEDPLIRLGTLTAMQNVPLQQRLIAFPLVWDDLRSIRIEAARLMAGYPREQFKPGQIEVLEQVIKEYIEVQEFTAERPESQLNLAGLYTELEQFDKAEVAYRQALKLQPQFVPAYVNFSQVLSNRGREKEAENLLRRGIGKVPDNATLHHALGLSQVRQKQLESATRSLQKAHELAPESSRYAYVYAVALQSTGDIQSAISVLEQTHKLLPDDPEILFTLATFHRDAGDNSTALDYAKKLQALVPGNPAIEQLVRQLQAPE